MTIPYKILFCIVLMLWSTKQLQGQGIDDWEARPSIGVEHEFDNGIKARFRYRHILDNNMSHYKASAFDFKIDYEFKINSWLVPSVDYRYKFNGEEGHHDIRYSAEIYQKLGKALELEYSPKFQQIIGSGERPEFYLRNEIEMAYLVSDTWSIFVFSENYQSLNEGVKFDAQKSGFGTEFLINQTNEIEFKMDIKNKSSHEDIGRVTLSYTYIIQ